MAPTTPPTRCSWPVLKVERKQGSWANALSKICRSQQSCCGDWPAGRLHSYGTDAKDTQMCDVDGHLLPVWDTSTFQQNRSAGPWPRRRRRLVRSALDSYPALWPRCWPPFLRWMCGNMFRSDWLTAHTDTVMCDLQSPALTLVLLQRYLCHPATPARGHSAISYPTPWLFL